MSSAGELIPDLMPISWDSVLLTGWNIPSHVSESRFAEEIETLVLSGEGRGGPNYQKVLLWLLETFCVHSYLTFRRLESQLRKPWSS